MGDHEIQGGELIEYRGEGGDVVIPEGVTSIGNCAFADCEELVSVVIPDGVTHIGAHAFEACTGLRSVVIPESVTGIGVAAFADCTGLASVTIRGIRFEPAELDLLVRKTLTDVPRIITQLVTYQAAMYTVVWTAFWHCPEDRRNNAFIQAHFEKMLRYLIEQKDVLTLEEALQCGAFDEELKKCADRCIEYAIAKAAVEMQLMLTNHKAEKLGFAETAELFRL